MVDVPPGVPSVAFCVWYAPHVLPERHHWLVATFLIATRAIVTPTLSDAVPLNVIGDKPTYAWFWVGDVIVAVGRVVSGAVFDTVNGFVVAPEPEAVAEAVNALARDKARAASLGEAGYDRARTITWDGVIEKLVT